MKKQTNASLEDITAGVEAYRQSGATEEQIAEVLKEFHYTPASYELALKNKSEKEDKGEGFWTSVDKYIRGDSDEVKMGGANFASGMVRDVANTQDAFTSGASIYARAGIQSVKDKYKIKIREKIAELKKTPQITPPL